MIKMLTKDILAMPVVNEFLSEHFPTKETPMSIVNADKPKAQKKYIISWTNLSTVNTFHSSSPQQVEIVEGGQEVRDYLKWCYLQERMADMDEYLKKYPVYIYEVSNGLKAISSSNLENL
jgi:hypothetical protein